MIKNQIERPAVVIALLAIAVGVMLSGCWNAPFNAVDDPLTLRQMLSHTVPEMFVPKPGKHFIPLTDLSYRFDYLFAPQKMVDHMNDALQGKPVQFDVNQTWATNVRLMGAFYHFIAAILLWIFLKRIGAGAGVALFAAMAWAGHPMVCESVCWIAERKNVLAAMFGFGALAAWTVDSEKWWRWPLVYLLYVLALLSKPAAISILPVLLALEVVDPIQHQFQFRQASHWLRLLKRTGLLIVLGFIWAQFGRYVYSLEIVKDLGGGLGSILMTDVWILARYIMHIVFPVHLHFLYHIDPITSPLDSRLWLSAVFLAAVFGGIIALTERSRRPLAVFGIFWFVAALGPNLSLITTFAPLQDRWAYISMTGFVLALSLAIDGLFMRREILKPALQYIAGAAMLALLIAAGVHSRVYASTEVLIADTAGREPKSGYAQLLTAELCSNKHKKAVDQRNSDEAITWGKRALTFYARALAAPDIEYFKDMLELRTRMAEILIALRENNQAQKVLEGWLPPPNRTMVKADPTKLTVRSRLELEKTYTSDTLAHAWNLMAECSLQQANQPGLEKAKSFEFCRRAIEEVEKAKAADSDGDRGELIKARALMLRSYLEAESGRDADAHKTFSDAQDVLKALPDTSPSAGEGRALLARAKPPKSKIATPPSLVPDAKK